MNDITYIGKVVKNGKEVNFGIKEADRFQHLYILGQSGVGKSTLLENMIMQDINSGKGVCVLDPHGELAQTVAHNTPPHRRQDIMILDPSDPQSFTINPLEKYDNVEKSVVSAGLLSVFTKIWHSAWSARMEYILNMSLMTLLQQPKAKLTDIRRLLTDKEFLKQSLMRVTDEEVLDFWQKEYTTWNERYKQEAIAPILNKIGQLTSNSYLRAVLTDNLNNIDIYRAMNDGKIIILNLAKGIMGEDNSALLGSLFLNKIYQETMRRSSLSAEVRRPFFIYIDEFQDFATKSLEQMLSESRKYKVSLTMANQFLDQLKTKEDDFIKKAVFGNVGSILAFRVSGNDAKILTNEFGHGVEPENFLELENYSYIARILIDGAVSKPFLAKSLMNTGFSQVVQEKNAFALPGAQLVREL